MYARVLKLILILSLLRLAAQDRIITTYSIYDGLPTQKIFDCTQDTLGFMWFAAEGGLIKYDGFKWEYFNNLDSVSNIIDFAFLKKDNNCNIWAFPQPFKETIYLYNYSQINKFNKLSIGEQDQFILAAALSINQKDTTIAVLTNSAEIYVYGNKTLNKVDYFKNSPIHVFDVDIIASALLVSTSDGLYEVDLNSLNTDKLTFKKKFDYKPVLSTTVTKTINNFSELLVLTNSSLLLIEDNDVKTIKDRFDIYYRETSLNYFFVNMLKSHKYFFGSKFEAFSYESISQNLSPLNENLGYTSSGATSAYVDREGNVWITSLRGINKIPYTPFSNYYKIDGLLQSEVTAIEKFPNGYLALAHNAGFTLYEKNSLNKIELSSESLGSSTRVLNMEYDKYRDVIWFISYSKGIGYLTRNGNLKWVLPNKSINERLYLSIYADPNGKLFYADDTGVYSVISGQINPVATVQNIHVRKIIRYDDTHLLIASKKGLGIIDEKTGNLSLFQTGNRLFDNCYAVFKINSDEWLVGSYGGLLVFDGASVKSYKELSINNPVFFIEKENDFIWFGLMGGALRWNPITNEQKFFTVKEGLAGLETNRDAYFFDGNKVYIGTNKGLSIFLPEIYDDNLYKNKPDIMINDIIDGYDFHYTADDEVALPFNRNNIILKYKGISFINEKKNKYFIHVKNLDDDFIETFETNYDQYALTNIQPGKYVVGINAVNANGISSDTVYTSLITIKTPFYLEEWFIVTMIIIAITISYSFYDFINKNKYAKKLELEVDKRTEQLRQSEQSIRVLTQKLINAQEEERERIARELHDNIAQDLAIIKSEMNSISQKNGGIQAEKTHWLSQKLTDLTDYIRDMAFFLHPNSIKQTGLLNAIQTLCAEQSNYANIKIDYFSNISEPLQLDEETEINIYRFIQEALTNIRKHARAGNAIVIMVKKNNTLSIRIEDDGIGFNMVNLHNHNNDKKMGLKSMDERIKIMNGELTIKSVVGEGTKINAQIPLKKIS